VKSHVVPLGVPAPDFDAPALDGGRVTLGGLRGQKIVLVFYRGHW
jgi:peroxiredoxin